MPEPRFTMPDLQPFRGWVETEKAREGPSLDDVFKASSAGEAAQLAARRRLTPTLSLDDAVRTLTHFGASPDRIRIIPVGIERSWMGEVIGQWPPAGTSVALGTDLVVFVTMAGLQHRLPEGILPSPVAREISAVPWVDSGEATDELLLEYREIDAGRRLLKILDGWLGRARAQLIQLQDAFDGIGAAVPFAQHLLYLVRLDHLPVDDASSIWLSGTLPRLPSSIGVPESTGELLTSVFGGPTRVGEGPPPAIPIPEEFRNRLGSRNSRLGKDLVPGRTFVDGRPSVRVITGPNPALEARAAVVEIARRESIAAWTAATLPSREPATIRHEVVPRDRLFRLGRDAANAVLGVTTYFLDAREGEDSAARSES